MFAHWRDNTFLFSAIVIVGAVVASWLLDQLFDSTAAVLLILQLAVVVVAFQCNSRFAYAAAVIEALSFNFFFTTPRYSLQMFRPEDIFNLVVFMVVAFITSTFADLYRRQQGELKQTKLQNSILLSVSHDLRTPLATIIGTLTTLNEYMPKLNDLERKELLDSATSESHRLHQYIENLLQATKLQHGTLKITKKDEPIANIVRDAVSRLPNYTEKVSMNMDDSVGYLSVSRSLIEQAIFNVLDNAMRFSPENESVEVSLSKQGLSCVIDVRDMGIGITAEDAEKIFSLFYSGANNKSADSGTGMGLAVAKGIITAHHASIRRDADPHSTSTQSRSRAGVSYKVLVVDDEPRIHTFIRISLSAEGFDYIGASTIAEAKACFEAYSPHVILLDLGLPDGDGTEFLTTLRQTYKTPVLVLTARDQEEEKIRLLEAGANDYLSKPFGVKELIARIKVLVRDLVDEQSIADELVAGRVKIIKSTHQFWLDQREIPLTKKEFSFIEQLILKPGKLIEQTHLLAVIWGKSHVEDTHYLRVLVSQLRKKLNDSADEQRLLKTEPGLGYRLVLETSKHH